MKVLMLVLAWLALATPAFAGFTSDYTATGALTATGTVAVQNNGSGTVLVSATGTGTGLTFSFQCFDGVNWISTNAYPISSGALGAPVTSASANGDWKINSAGCGYTSATGVRVNLTAISGGTETFDLDASTAGDVANVALLPGGPLVKPASTSASATDPSVVVQFSPNCTLCGLADASTFTGGTTIGSLVLGSVTSAAPTYTTGKVDALSLTTSGGLRTADGSDGATGSALPSTASLNGVNVGGNLTSPRMCQSTAVYDASTNGKTQMVALASSQFVYVCGFSLYAAGTVSVDVTQGTGTNCATGTNTKLTPTYQLTAQTGIVDRQLYWQGMKSIISQAVCIETNAAVAVQAIVYYDQGT